MTIMNSKTILRKEPYPRNILLLLLETSPIDLNITAEQIPTHDEGLQQAIAILPEWEQQVLKWRYAHGDGSLVPSQ